MIAGETWAVSDLGTALRCTLLPCRDGEQSTECQEGSREAAAAAVGGIGEGGFGVTLTQVAVVQLLLVTVFHGFPEPFPKGPA